MNTTPPPSLLGDLPARVAELLRSGPAADVARNLPPLPAPTSQLADLAPRAQFDPQLERLAPPPERP